LLFVSLASPGEGAGKAGESAEGKEPRWRGAGEAFAFSYEANELIARGPDCSALTAPNNAEEEKW